jgi:dihydrofolate synthase/folylpolyglutamate synthase
MTYPQALKYLASFINYEKIPAYPYKESLKLERVKDFLGMLNNPQDSLRCVHVAGTKGKGSTCAFIAYILREAGFKVGLYTSPHLSDFRERIRILEPALKYRRQTNQKATVALGLRQTSCVFEGMISGKELTDLVRRIRPAIERYNQSSRYGPLSFFEVYTSLAFTYFKEKKVEIVVLETGLGGRLDATNTVKPLVCVITPISYEHTQKLGNTLTEIAQEKAGIIKPHLPVVSAPQKKEAREVIRNRCQKVGARLYEVRKGTRHKIRLLGEHQLINAAVAKAAVDALGDYRINISRDAIKKGLYNTLWPGRCEIVSRHPLIILDGAQNIDSAKAIKKAIKENFKYDRLLLILGVSCDKDIKGICAELYDFIDKVILTKANNPRAAEPEELAKYFLGKEKYLTKDTAEALRLARLRAEKSDLILITGSLFIIGELRELFNNIYYAQ